MAYAQLLLMVEETLARGEEYVVGAWLKENDVLTEDFIKKLDKDKQEVCNQLNRRTEFIVLRTTYGMFDKEGNLKQSNNEATKKPSSSAEKGKKNEDFDFYVE